MHQELKPSQIGCGKSTLLDERKYDSLWVRETFVEELQVVYEQLGLQKGEYEIVPS